MANNPGQARTMFYIIFCGVPLVAMIMYGFYLYYYDYGPDVSPEFHAEEPPDRRPVRPSQPAVPMPVKAVRFVASVKVEPAHISAERGAGRDQPVTAELVITNEGNSAVPLVYTPWPSALLDVRLHYLGADGKGKPERLRGTKAYPMPFIPPNPNAPRPQRHVVILIPPGDKFSLPVNLVPPFDLSRLGVYRLEVLYDPLSFCSQMRLNVNALGVYAMPIQTPAIEFNVGDEKTTAPEAKTGEEKSPEAQGPEGKSPSPQTP